MRTLISAIFCIAATSAAIAGPVDPGFATSTLPADDDGSTGAVGIGFNVDFFGSTYNSLYVNNNGNLTFNGTQSTYTPSGLGAGYSGQPIIAPFFADVDTRGAGSGLTSYGTGTYNGFQAFGATWPLVGYYSSGTDKLNTFQVIITNRSDVGTGDFDIYFNYNQIQWETGSASGGSDGLGGVSAAVGFNAGQPGDPAGTYYQFAGSLVNGALIDGGPDSLTAGTNDGVTGQYLFNVRDGIVTAPPPPPPTTGVPEPDSVALLALGALGLVAARRKQKQA